LGGDLGEAPIAIGQETSPAEVNRLTKRAVEPMGKRALGVDRLAVEEGAVIRGEDRGDQVGNAWRRCRKAPLQRFLPQEQSLGPFGRIRSAMCG